MITERELAFFGGWTRRVMSGGDQAWGDPRNRVQEVVPSTTSGLIVPPDSPLLQRGIPFYVVNTGTDFCIVKRPSGTTIWAVAAGTVAMITQGSDWYGWGIGPAQFGAAPPTRTIHVDLTQNEANVDLLAKCIAQGYDGTESVAVLCTVRSGVAIGTVAQGQRSLNSGNTIGSVSWLSGSYWTLIVEPDAIVGGWGGPGGRNGVPGAGPLSSAGLTGLPGGQAIRTWIPMNVDVRSGGVSIGGGGIFGGGGGGGGGHSSPTNVNTKGGGGGGGRGCNMTANGVLIGSAGGAAPNAQAGASGGPFTAGIGGFGIGNGGNGGRGGLAGQNGLGGNQVGNFLNGAVGGAGGAAISYEASPPTILGGGSLILGGIVMEAS